jgi:hypothetical protein
MLDAGLSIGDLADLIREGLFTFEFLDQYYVNPAPRSGRTYDEFAKSIGEKARLLPEIYVSMGLPQPQPSSLLRSDEEEVLAEFLEAWSEGGDDDTYTRAARLVGEPARVMTDGWVNLHVEKIAEPLVARGAPTEERIATIVDTATKAAKLAPRMLLWLQQRHMRNAIDRSIFESLERDLSEHGFSPLRSPRSPVIAFVDLSGYTGMTEDHGDEVAARSADLLRDRAGQAARRHDGSLVKLLGDGAMLHFRDHRERRGRNARDGAIARRREPPGARGHARWTTHRTRRRLLRTHGEPRLKGRRDRQGGGGVGYRRRRRHRRESRLPIRAAWSGRTQGHRPARHAVPSHRGIRARPDCLACRQRSGPLRQRCDLQRPGPGSPSPIRGLESNRHPASRDIATQVRRGRGPFS